MCLASVMNQRRGPTIALAILAVFALLSGCSRPISDTLKLRALKTEAQSLKAGHPIKSPKVWAEVPKSQWPPVIAGLEPYSVTVHQWGVDILVKPDFDGGWGYHVPRNKRDMPMPAGCYSEPSEGVFWHGSC